MRTIKIVFDNATAVRLPLHCSWEAVEASLNGAASLSFVDEDGDTILVRNAAELEGACLYQSGRPTVQLRATRPSAPFPAATKQQAMTRHELLRKLLDLGFHDMQRNLIAGKRTGYQLDSTIALLVKEKRGDAERSVPTAGPAASVVFPALRRVRPGPQQIVTRHELLRRLLDLGFCDMEKNLLAAKRADGDLDRTVELLVGSVRNREAAAVAAGPVATAAPAAAVVAAPAAPAAQPPLMRLRHASGVATARHEMIGALLDMGFSDMTKVLQAASQTGYDMERTIALLLGDESWGRIE